MSEEKADTSIIDEEKGEQPQRTRNPRIDWSGLLQRYFAGKERTDLGEKGSLFVIDDACRAWIWDQDEVKTKVSRVSACNTMLQSFAKTHSKVYHYEPTGNFYNRLINWSGLLQRYFAGKERTDLGEKGSLFVIDDACRAWIWDQDEVKTKVSRVSACNTMLQSFAKTHSKVYHYEPSGKPRICLSLLFTNEEWLALLQPYFQDKAKFDIGEDDFVYFIDKDCREWVISQEIVKSANRSRKQVFASLKYWASRQKEYYYYTRPIRACVKKNT